MFFFFFDGFEQRLTLYLQHDPRGKPDVGTVARTLIHYENSLQKISAFLDPSAQIRIELQGIEEGSLRLITTLKSAKAKFAKYPITFGVAAAFSYYLLSELGSYGISNGLDYIFKNESSVHISKESLLDISRSVAETCRLGVGENDARKIYQELHGDPVVTGLSLIPGHHTKPSIIIPRSQFAERGTIVEKVASDTRTIVKPETLILVRPDLTRKNRKWVFSTNNTEFSARILDDLFLRSLENGTSDIPLTMGIVLEALVETIEEKIDGVWRPTTKNVQRIITVRPPMKQRDLNFDDPND
ncbi:hypothetical protein NJB95_08885 [Brucella intermedia]|uniref:hypothetical protein n=1 Tax=Brucella intermedia TaxID=94625 RepID=UPI00209AD22C|nr:hypothetical protein [Brucella intermedia]MCO7736731.1 hypothetical protein [Brucella intermedia]WLF99393.1 hypothetical protein Q5698_16950 [Brucella intermedia]